MSIFHTPSKSIFVLILVGILIVPLTTPLLPTIAGATNGGFSCPLTPQSGRTIIDFPSNWDMRDDRASRRQFGPMPVSVPSGTYDVTLVSYDDGHPQGRTQPNEQWFMELINGSSVIFTSDAVSDIPDDEIAITEIVNTNVTLSTNATGVQVEHAYPKSAPTANSVIAVCAAFDLVVSDEPRECKLSITKEVDKTTANIGDTLTYTVRFENVGNANCTGGGVRVQDTIDLRLTYLSETRSQNISGGYDSFSVYDANSNVLRWNAHTLKPGETGWISWKGLVGTQKQCGDFNVFNIAKITAQELNNFNDWVTSNEVKTSVDNDCNETVTCPLTPQPNRTIVEFPADWRLLSNKTNRRDAGPITLPVPISTGDYNITLVSTDPSHPSGKTQPQEQWYVRGLNNGGAVFNSPSTTDLPNGIITLAEKVASGFSIYNTTTELMAVHAAPKSAPTANSITPVCVAFDKIPEEPTITLVKKVLNDDGGTASISDFTLKVDSTTVISGTPLTVTPGTYTASEINLPGYTAGKWAGDCNKNGEVTVAWGEHAVCEIENDDLGRPTIKLIKKVINNDGGTLSVSDFTLRIGGTDVTSGKKLTVAPGTYTASEIQNPDYSASNWSGDCSANGEVTVSWGDNAVCTITNDDIPEEPKNPTITLIKTVINNNGKTLTVSDFTLKVGSTTVTSGTPLSVTPGTYTASEIQNPDYNAGFWGGDCSANGTVTVAFGDNATCTITNDDKGGGGSSSPRLVIVKSVSPTFTNPDTTITYTVIVTNKGYATAVDVTMRDILPEPYFSYSDGTVGLEKTWSLGNLAQNESETTTFDVNVSEDTLEAFYTNTATAKAKNNGQVSDTAIVEVRGGGVLGKEFFPKLEIEKTVSPPFTTPGGSATYTIVVRNVGEAVAENVTIEDIMPKELTEVITGQKTLNWSIGDLIIGQEWSVTYEATVSKDAAPDRSYRNIASADADNADKVLDPADIEVREGKVLGFDTIPETGAFDGAAMSLLTMTLTSLLGYGAITTVFARRKKQGAEAVLKRLARRAR